MVISLVVTTNKRVDDMKKLIDSIINDKYKDNIELVVVDQSDNDCINGLVASYQNLIKIKYIKTDRLSLSKARNIGISNISGDIIGFPDDDCWYSEGFFEKIINRFNLGNVDCLLTKVYDPVNKRKYSNIEANQDIVKVNKFNLFTYTTSVGIFVKRDALIEFDERLGLGAPWFGGEDLDYIMNLLDKNLAVEYHEKIVVHHLAEIYGEDYEKAYKYAIGLGALVKKNFRGIKQTPYIYIFYKWLFKSITALIIYSVLGKSKRHIYLNRVKGMIYGFNKFDI